MNRISKEVKKFLDDIEKETLYSEIIVDRKKLNDLWENITDEFDKENN